MKKVTLKSLSLNPKWKDSRVYQPPTTFYQEYLVKLWDGNSIHVGFAGFSPKNDYTEGEWVNMSHLNSGKYNDEIVLEWMPTPKIEGLCFEDWYKNEKNN